MPPRSRASSALHSAYGIRHVGQSQHTTVKEKSMGDRIRRSWLIVPAHDEARLEEAAHASADVIVLDLQDTVHDTKKHVARARIRATIPRLCAKGAEVYVRDDIDVLD